MNLDRVREIVGPDTDRLYEEFRLRFGHGDVEAFVARLHMEGRIDDDKANLLWQVEAVPSGRFDLELKGLLGKGAMGEVFLAHDHKLRRTVALKKLDKRIQADPMNNARFLREVLITAQLDHPGIVPVYSMEPDGYTMKVVRGKTLRDVLDAARAACEGGRPDGREELESRLDVILRVCETVHFAHSRGVLHRDLKPQNIMVGPFGEVFVMDWGIAKVRGQSESPGDLVQVDGDGERTQIGLAVGTPAYMSPEQARGENDDLDARSDVYSIGLMLQESLTLQRAVTARTALATLARAQEGDRNPIEHVKGKVLPKELVAVAEKALARGRDLRYASAEALAADIRRYLRDEAVLALPDTPTMAAQRWVSHNRASAIGIAGALVLAIFALGGGGMLLRARDQAQAREHEARLGALLAEVSRQGHALDAEFQRYAGLLRGVSFAWDTLGRATPAPTLLTFSRDFAAGKGPDLTRSTVYGSTVSVGHVDLTLAPGVAEDPAELARLAALQPSLQEVLLRSAGEDKMKLDDQARARLIRDQGTPVRWAYLATEGGRLAGYPGTGVYPEGYDPREQEWYQAGLAASGPTWTPATLDESGQGLLVTCVDRVDGGVAAVDITVDYLVERMLKSRAGELTLVDAEGKVVVRSTMSSRDVATRQAFPHKLEGKSGWRELPDDQLIAWSSLDAVDWTLVVVGDEESLLAAYQQP